MGNRPGRRVEKKMSNRRRTGLVVDVETTGLNPLRDEIIELALIRFSFDQSGKIDPDSIVEYTGLREPSCNIPQRATRVHGLTMDDVRGFRFDEERVRELVTDIDFCIAHHAAFDRPFLERLLPVFRNRVWLCTMTGIAWHRWGAPSRKLENLALQFGIEHDRPHRALHDARMTLALLSLIGPDNRSLLTNLVCASAS